MDFEVSDLQIYQLLQGINNFLCHFFWNIQAYKFYVQNKGENKDFISAIFIATAAMVVIKRRKYSTIKDVDLIILGF